MSFAFGDFMHVGRSVWVMCVVWVHLSRVPDYQGKGWILWTTMACITVWALEDYSWQLLTSAEDLSAAPWVSLCVWVCTRPAACRHRKALHHLAAGVCVSPLSGETNRPRLLHHCTFHSPFPNSACCQIPLSAPQHKTYTVHTLKYRITLYGEKNNKPIFMLKA